MFHSHFFEVQYNIINLIKYSSYGCQGQPTSIPESFTNGCQGTFIWHLTDVLLIMMELLSILYMILGIPLQGCQLDPTLKINMMMVLCRSFAPMRIEFVFKFVGIPCLHSLLWKSLVSLSNDVHLKDKTFETVGKSYTSLKEVPSVKCLKVNFLIGNKACAYQSCVKKLGIG